MTCTFPNPCAHGMLLRLKRSRSSTASGQALAARLPPEITQLILLEIAVVRADLARALRVCRAWHAFVGMLYESVHLDLAALIRFHHTVCASGGGGRLAARVRELYREQALHLPSCLLLKLAQFHRCIACRAGTGRSPTRRSSTRTTGGTTAAPSSPSPSTSSGAVRRCTLYTFRPMAPLRALSRSLQAICGTSRG